MLIIRYLIYVYDNNYLIFIYYDVFIMQILMNIKKFYISWNKIYYYYIHYIEIKCTITLTHCIEIFQCGNKNWKHFSDRYQFFNNYKKRLKQRRMQQNPIWLCTLMANINTWIRHAREKYLKKFFFILNFLKKFVTQLYASSVI